MSLTKKLSIFVFCLFGVYEPLWAQPVPSREPASTHIFPAGGRRGTTVHVLVGGECIPPGTTFRIAGSGVTAQMQLGPQASARLEPSPRREPREVPICYPKEWESSIEIESDTHLGPRMWRLTCARGGTGSRPFIVGDLPEFIETESNSIPVRAEHVVLPVTINGRIAGESDLDYYAFSARHGEVILCDVVAARLGSALDPVIEITDSAGQRVTADEIRFGSDPVLAFRAPATGDYRLLISNVSFQGGPAHVYRVTLRAMADLPKIVSPSIIEELLDRGWISSVAESAVDGDLHYADPSTSGSPDPYQLDLPATVRGRLAPELNERWFSFDAEKDQPIEFECRPFPSGLAMLPLIAVFDAGGKQLAECKSTESADRACLLDWRAPESGNYRIRVRDAQQGASAGVKRYELTLRRIRPDFALQLKADFANVVQGAKSELEVKVRRSAGFDGPVEIVADGLPAGVVAEPLQLAPNQDTAKLVIVANDEARPCESLVRVIGRASIGESRVERVATAPHMGRDMDGTSIGPPQLDTFSLTVQHKPVFRLFCSEAYQYAYRGTIYPYAMQVERLGGFDGEITIQLGDRQNRDLDGVQFIEAKVPPGVTETRVPIYFPETMHINVLSQSQIYAQGYAFFTDKWGQRQATLVVSEKRNMVRTMPTVVKLTAADRELNAQAGSTVLCKLALDRTSNFTGAMDVELLEPSAGCVAEPVQIRANEVSAEIAVHVPARIECSEPVVLRFRVRGQLAPDVAVISETSVPLRIE
jgi:hypothetical protein